MKKNFSAVNREVFSTYDYADFAQLAVDTGLDTLKGVSKEEANEKLREIFNAVLGVDKDTSRKELRKAMRRRKTELFEVTEEIVERLVVGGWGETAFFKEYVDYKNGDYGDTNQWTVPDDTVLTVSELAGNNHDIIRQRLGSNTVYSVKTQWYGLKIYAEFERFLAGLVDWAAFVQQIYRALNEKVTALTYAAFESAPNYIPNNSQFVKTGSLVEATLLTLIEDVQAANPGKEVIIMGTKSALSKLNSLEAVEWISDSAKEEMHSLGRMGIWQGTRLVELEQRFALGDLSKKLINPNRLLVMPVDSDNKMVKIYNEGDGMLKEVSDGTTNVDMTIEYEYQIKMGAAVVFHKYFGVWTMA